ncbi:unnamed protein product [Didymodactylos carnosus]|uniref:Uncharacterized protein n=1 Tax=Didymodactylos carnosus TaxID=1234261 RepID=A0A8S2FTM8_9BILA|nr:unnamed protein product [Didymodactylos carnosus]CAF4342218.1 unnamed protein product [Didymodactylos carnosus]
MMIKRTWGIYKYKVSTNEEPYHKWRDPKCCGYWKSLQLGEDYDHSSHALPPAVMKAVKPVFQELASEENLKRVLNGSTQNPSTQIILNLGEVGYFTIISLKRIDKARIYIQHKETIRKIKQKTAIANNNDDSDFDSGDIDVLYSMIDNSNDYVPGEY